jgi:hypothetical protein
MKGALRGDRLEDSPMRNSAVGYKPTVPFRKTYGIFSGDVLALRGQRFNSAFR